jgi:hypothetical protein
MKFVATVHFEIDDNYRVDGSKLEEVISTLVESHDPYSITVTDTHVEELDAEPTLNSKTRSNIIDYIPQ